MSYETRECPGCGEEVDILAYHICAVSSSNDTFKVGDWVECNKDFDSIFYIGRTVLITKLSDHGEEATIEAEGTFMYIDTVDLISVKNQLGVSADTVCTECGGTGKYVGLNSVEPCRRCKNGI